MTKGNSHIKVRRISASETKKAGVVIISETTPAFFQRLDLSRPTLEVEGD
jgi:hypothetical protein